MQNQKRRKKKRSVLRQQVRYQISKLKEDERIRYEAVRKRVKKEGRSGIRKQILKIMLPAAGCVALIFLVVQFVLPGTILKRKQIIDDTPIEERLEAALSDAAEEEVEIGKEYARLEDTTEEQLLWDLLMDYFQGNRTAVLGVMCNLHAESNLTAANLEDYNNRLWDISDDIYTEEVNRKTIGKKDFLEARTVDSTNGYYNEDDQWVNRDGGYGYAQFTAYDKKEALYQFAEQWFGPGGQGENYKFNIGDPVMQAHYVIELLKSDEYHEMEDLIRNAEVTVDACYYWLKMYEEPYDPYCDGYYTLAFERAEVADEIESRCLGTTEGTQSRDGLPASEMQGREAEMITEETKNEEAGT